MPTWRVSQCLPATLRSFDLVVIDEASQSNVGAVLPLLRATRVLVVGDGKQARCGRDAAEMRPRCGRDATSADETWQFVVVPVAWRIRPHASHTPPPAPAAA